MEGCVGVVVMEVMMMRNRKGRKSNERTFRRRTLNRSRGQSALGLARPLSRPAAGRCRRGILLHMRDPYCI